MSQEPWCPPLTHALACDLKIKSGARVSPFWEREKLHEQHLETPVPCKVPPATAVPRGPLTLGPGSNAQGDLYRIAGILQKGGGVG